MARWSSTARWSAIGGAALAALSGCAGRGPLDSDHESALRRDLGPLSAREQRLIAERPAPAGDPLPESVTVDDYVALALEHHPAIIAAEQRLARLREAPEQARTLDDPMLEVTPLGEMAETAAGEVTTMVGVSQRFPFPGTLAARARVAEQEAAIAERELERTRQAVAAEVRRAYWRFYTATRAVELTRRSRDVLAQFVEIAEAQYRAGTATQQDVLRASVELADLDNELITLAQQAGTAAARLNSLIDRPVDSPVPPPRRPEPASVELRLEPLLAQAARSNPGIERLREQAASYRRRRELARLGRLPELSVSASYNLVDDEGLSPVATGDDQWWVGFGLSIPIWQNRRSAAEREAMRGVLESLAEVRAEHNAVALRVQESLTEAQAREQRAALLRESIIPQARQTLDASLGAYRAGTVDFLTVADNWRRLLAFELMHEESLAETQRALADLAEAVGAADRPGWPAAPPNDATPIPPGQEAQP